MTTTDRRPLPTTLLRTCRCADCLHQMPDYTPARKVNGRTVCEGCAERYEWDGSGWVIVKSKKSSTN